jgi:hypothetical protein
VREQAPAHKKKADVHKQKAPAAAGGLAPTGKEGGHQTVGGATVKQAVKQAGAGVSGVSKEGLVKIKIDYPHPHTWVFEQQPKRTAYGGIGFAKPSTWLPMPTDRNSVEYSDFIDKFEEVWPSSIQPSPDPSHPLLSNLMHFFRTGPVRGLCHLSVVCTGPVQPFRCLYGACTGPVQPFRGLYGACTDLSVIMKNSVWDLSSGNRHHPVPADRPRHAAYSGN